MNKDLYYNVRTRQYLWGAWRHVRQAGLQSSSAEIREAVEAYDLEADRRIKRIQARLKDHSFTFRPARGVLKRRVGKRPRPIVVSHLDERIVQRSVLSVLQSRPEIQDIVRIPTSFGGIEGQGVREALRTAFQRIESGAVYFARSDIRDFFQCIPKETVLGLIKRRIKDREVVEFLAQAISVELENLGPLGRDAALFPLHEIGVAQGCCLSPLLGNILLHDFDVRLNGRGLHCLRYIDDFLLLGPSERSVRKGFESALTLLGAHGLSAYDPWAGDEKAERGPVGAGFDFLGCEVKGGQIRPDKRARKRLLTKVREAFRKSAATLRSGDIEGLVEGNLVSTLRRVSNIVKGWGNQYSFCNDPRLWSQLDGEIDILVRNFLGQYGRARAFALGQEGGQKLARRLLGVHLLADSKHSPIVKT